MVLTTYEIVENEKVTATKAHGICLVGMVIDDAHKIKNHLLPSIVHDSINFNR